MLDNEYKVSFIPSEEDKANLAKITTFLEENEIEYKVSSEIFGLISIQDAVKGNEIELRYVSSAHYPMDNSKRFGSEYVGVPKNYFIDISQGNITKNIRTIWIFDFEMNQSCDVPQMDGTILKDYHRQWEVIKNTIRTATGHIHHRFYARDCEVCVVDNTELRAFLNTNCFYGYRAANINLGLRLKKDKNGFKKGTLLMCYTFGLCYYGNKTHQDEPKIEIIRVSSKVKAQIIGGASKSLKYFLENYPTLIVNSGKERKEVKVNELIFYVDASHNDGRAMSSMGFEHVSWKGEGFMNVFLDNVDEVYIRPDGKKVAIKGEKGKVGHRQPLAHKRIMELIKERKIVSVANAGTDVWHIFREEYLKQFEK